MTNKSENWGVEDEYGTCACKGMTEGQAEQRAEELRGLTGKRWYVVDMSVEVES